MPFVPGTGGRQKGSLNKRSTTFLEVLEKKKFCPASALIQCYEDARFVYSNYATIYEAICNARDIKGLFPVEDKADKYLKMAIDCAKDLAGFAYPKIKAIEQIRPNPTEHLSPEQKLEALQQMTKLLEMEIARNEASPIPETT